jgi:polar amino acid transport system substrate-binding protein
MLIAAINPTMALIHNIDVEGNIIGLDVDLGNATAERLCLKMNFQSTQFATMIPMLKERRIDMINSFMFYTPEGASQVLMVPYGASAMAIVVPKTNTDAIGGPEYFSGKSMAVERSTIDLKDVQAASDALSVNTALSAGLRLVVHQE